MATTKIEWATTTWNPITGCDPISEGCQHCYAKRMATRLAGRYGYPKDDPFRVTFHEDRLNEPFRWRKPRMVFVCSMGDLFHKDAKPEWIYDVFRVMEKCQQHTFMLLTKRPERMRQLINGVVTGHATEHRRHIWIGVTAENQSRFMERVPVLLKIPAETHFVSVEPMLSNICADSFLKSDLNGCEIHCPGTKGMCRLYFGECREAYNHVNGIDWVICGAETGQGKREMKTEWARSLRDQCVSSDVAFFFKKDSHGGRELDGKIWEQYPPRH